MLSQRITPFLIISFIFNVNLALGQHEELKVLDYWIE